MKLFSPKYAVSIAAMLVAYSPQLATAKDDLKSLFSVKDGEVISVSKTPEKAFNAASAIYVVSNEDIKRSGSTSVPEALRMVPGLEVARIDSNKWAITSRGFNRQFANKLLVMIDGRTVYTPLFSGTYWDTQDVMLEDIDRIEVIRGPGATQWGANAVNGVINIITKDARLTQDKIMSGLYGNKERGTVAGRYGGKVGKDIYYRTYSKYTHAGPSYQLNGQSANNEAENAQGGFRMDWQKDPKELVTMQGDVYNGYNEYPLTLPGITGAVAGDENTTGGNFLSKWSKVASNTSKFELQAYVDYTKRDIAVLSQERKTADIDFQNTLTGIDRNEITWGLGYRFFVDDLISKQVAGTKYIDYTPDKSYNSLYSSFVQDKIALSPSLYLTLGSKFEHNYYTGFNVQPSARLAWLATDKQTLWTSVSKSVRTPSRGEDDINLIIGGTSPNFARQVGSAAMKAEEMVAYEAGYRVMPKSNLTFDVSTFFNDYNYLRSFERTGLIYNVANHLYGETYGVEVSSDWGVTDNWHLVAGYSFLTINLHNKPGSLDTTSQVDEKASPTNQYKIASHLNLPHHLSFDNMLYYVSSLGAYNIPGYTRIDTSISWEARDGLELSLVGQNLTDERHQEFTKALYSVNNTIGRSIYGKVTLRF